MPSLISGSTIDALITEASTSCAAKRGSPDSNLWEALAERKQTARLLQDYVQNAKTGSSALVKAVSNRNTLRQLIQSARAARVPVDVYLMTRYGLLPTISDAKFIMKQMEKSSTGKIRQTFRGVSTANEVWNDLSIVPTELLSINVQKAATDTVVIRAMSLDEWDLSVLDNFGLNLKALLKTPYELITLSFVADWFTNLGDVYAAALPPGTNQLGACVVMKRVRNYVGAVVGGSDGSNTLISPSSVSQAFRLTETVRSPGLPAPRLVVRRNFGLDPTDSRNYLRLADAAALISQRVLSVVPVVARAMAGRHITTY